LTAERRASVRRARGSGTVVKAYEQVAEVLLRRVVAGELEPGVRLPTETMLATEFGVSRTTVREALRLLAAQNLVRTAKGATGGSYVTVPSAGHLSASLRSGIGLLADASDVSLEELLEARQLLEVPAARLAAVRRRDHDLERLRAAIPGRPLELAAQEQFAYNSDFHTVVLEAAGNVLLAIAAQPVFDVLQTRLVRSNLGARFHRTINAHHRSIADAIEAGDEDAAGGEMHDHIEFLRPFYEKAWRDLRKRP
jgi:GntR family transcriptional repressor for pyruvate dehydrogenase complex